MYEEVVGADVLTKLFFCGLDIPDAKLPFDLRINTKKEGM